MNSGYTFASGLGFLALSAARMPAWIVPLSVRVPAYSMLTEGLAVIVREEVRFQVRERLWHAPSVIFECRDLKFLRSFCAFVADLYHDVYRRIGRIGI